MTSFCPRTSLFGGFVDVPPHVWGQIPPNPQFLGCSPAKLVKSKNMHIIKTTACIPIKFCIMIKTTKCLSWVVQTRSTQMQDCGQPPSWKNRKMAIFRQWFNRSTRNLARQRNLTLLSLPTPKILRFWKSKISWKIEKWPYLSNALTDRSTQKFGTVTHLIEPLESSRP